MIFQGLWFMSFISLISPFYYALSSFGGTHRQAILWMKGKPRDNPDRIADKKYASLSRVWGL